MTDLDLIRGLPDTLEAQLREALAFSGLVTIRQKARVVLEEIVSCVS